MTLDILKFVFSSFWIWLGSAIMLSVLTRGAASLFATVVKAIHLRISQ